MIYIAYSKKCHSAYNVEIDETGNIVLTDINGNKAENAGHLISSMGGKEKFLSLCEEGDLAEAIAAKEERLRSEREHAIARNAEWEARQASKEQGTRTPTIVEYEHADSYNVKVTNEGRDIEMYLRWWNDDADKASFEQQLDLACFICGSYEDIVKHMRINGYDVEDVTDSVISNH